MHPQRSVITRALGTDPDVDVDAFSVDGEAGDLFLICSDGLSDMVDGDDDRGDPARAPRATSTRRRARSSTRRTARGGDDNITAVLFELVEAPSHGRRARRADARVHAIARRGGHAPSGGRRRAARRRHDDAGRAGSHTEGSVGPAGRARQAAPGARRVIVGARRRHRRARLVGARALTSISLRNRELLYLIGVGVLTGLGFASVYIARQSQVSWGSLSYALFFFGLYLAAHVVARADRAERRPVPAADGRAADGGRRDRDLPPRRRATRSSRASGS